MSKILLPSHGRRARRRQRGVTLIEALVALLVMSFGMLALVGLMSSLRFGADLAKQRSEAMRIARAEIAKLRDFSELSRGAATPSTARVYDEIIDQAGSRQETPDDSNTTYGVTTGIAPLTTGGQGLTVRVSVSWTDRAGDSQFVNLDTVIASIDPIFGAAVSITPATAPLTQPSARSPVIPVDAKKLDKDISAFRPSGLGSTVWVFNNLTGVIVGKCTIPAGTPVSTLTTADVDSCKNNTVGYLLSGVIRFSNTNPPNPAQPEASGLLLDLGIINATYLLPRLSPAGVPMMSGGNMVMDSFTATAPSGTSLPECFNDSAGGPTIVSYYCIVYPPDAGATGTRPTWSGKLVLTGFSTGTTAAAHRVCRYSADYNGSGSSFTADWKALENEEHPAVYAKVAGSLAQQNFLVVRGDLNCPTAPAVDPANGVFADYSTIQLQP